MAAFAAQLLDELMGRNRDANPNDKRRDIHWSDPEVCKYFICGICPHDLFTNTRADLGACTKLHDESIKKDYEKSSRFERMGYEEELLKYLNTVIVEADKRIQRGQQRLQMAAMEQTVPLTPEQIELDNKIELIKEQISELVAEAEALGNDGLVDEARDRTTQCDVLRLERLRLQEARDKLTRPFEEVYKRRPMEVCDICGAMLFVDDAPQRLDDHIMGKQHMGYARIRSYIDGYHKKRSDALHKREDGENGGKVIDEKQLEANDEKKVDVAENYVAAGAELSTEDRKRRDERSADRKGDDHSRRRSRDRDNHHRHSNRERSRERHKSSERGRHSGRSDRSRSRSRRHSPHYRSSRSDPVNHHKSRDRSQSRSRRDRSRSRHGSRR